MENKAGKFVVGCFISFFFIIFFIIVLGTFEEIFALSGIFSLIFIFFQIFVIYAIFRVLFSVLKGAKNVAKNSKQNTQEINEERYRENEENNYEETQELETTRNKTEMSLDIQKAFMILGLSPDVSYTKVSEKYYEMVKKINSKKMDENERQRILDELNKAYEIITDYYSKNF